MSILSANQFQTSQSHNYTHEICLFKYCRIYLHFIESTDLNIVKEATTDRTSRCSVSFKRWSAGFFLICVSDFLESLTLHLLLQPFPVWVRTQLLEQRIKGCVLASNFGKKKKYIYIYIERERERKRERERGKERERDKTFVYYHYQSCWVQTKKADASREWKSDQVMTCGVWLLTSHKLQVLKCLFCSDL